MPPWKEKLMGSAEIVAAMVASGGGGGGRGLIVLIIVVLWGPLTGPVVDGTVR